MPRVLGTPWAAVDAAQREYFAKKKAETTEKIRARQRAQELGLPVQEWPRFARKVLA
jgi:hypothetical protein